jgi:hypothetical protein
MLVKKATKSSNKSMGYRTPDFGDGCYWLDSAKYDLNSSNVLEPGLKVSLLVVGKLIQASTLVVHLIRTVWLVVTVIRPTGNIANKGVGDQYKLPKRFKGEDEVVDNNDDDTTIKTDDDTTIKTDNTTTNTGDDLTATTEPPESCRGS